jgi:hypothetical protein
MHLQSSHFQPVGPICIQTTDLSIIHVTAPRPSCRTGAAISLHNLSTYKLQVKASSEFLDDGGAWLLDFEPPRVNRPSWSRSASEENTSNRESWAALFREQRIVIQSTALPLHSVDRPVFRLCGPLSQRLVTIHHSEIAPSVRNPPGHGALISRFLGKQECRVQAPLRRLLHLLRLSPGSALILTSSVASR